MARTIKGIRSDLGLTQKEMASKLSISTGTYVRYENYETRIPFGIAMAICDLGRIDNPREIKFE